MMRLSFLFLILALAPGAVGAQEALSPEAFEQYATGKTLYYGKDGEVYGAEQYLPGRRVIWAFVDDDCKRGKWFPSGDQVCFVYEGDPKTHCWTFFDTGDGLQAQFEDDQADGPLIEVDQSAGALFCPGPEVGV